jgi:hypothetical protein
VRSPAEHLPIYGAAIVPKTRKSSALSAGGRDHVQKLGANDGGKRVNNEAEFDARIREALGGYVYALRDPRTREIFYIGKAGGWDAQGNDRVLAHFWEARAFHSDPQRTRSKKIERIIKVWESGHDVEWFVVRRGLLTEDEAFHVEAALIDLLEISSAPPALNDIGGIRGHDHGRLDAAGVRLLAAPKLGADGVPPGLAGRPIIIFNIQNALAAKRDPDVYGATRSAWKLGPGLRNQEQAIAVGLAAGISRGAWEIDSWVRTEDNKRWCFNGRELAADLIPHVSPRNFQTIIGHAAVRGYWQRGNPIAIEMSEALEFRVIHGSSDLGWHGLNDR